MEPGNDMVGTHQYCRNLATVQHTTCDGDLLSRLLDTFLNARTFSKELFNVDQYWYSLSMFITHLVWFC